MRQYWAQGFNDLNTAGDDYVYDENGNLIKDRNKAIFSIAYNALDLPEKIVFNGELNNNHYLLYKYDAAGNKLSQDYYNASGILITGIDYVGNFVYTKTQTEPPTLQLGFTAEGRIIKGSSVNLITNTATSEANTLEGFTATANVTLTRESVGVENYVKAVVSQAGGTPGIFPIGGSIPVKAGETYAFKIFGRQTSGTTASLYIWGNNGNLVWPGAPLSTATDQWATSSITIPVGVTQIKVGVQWNNPSAGNTFYINAVKVYKSDWEYQYFIADHQGSTRAVLQTAPGTFTFTATMESENFAQENSMFGSLNPTKMVAFSNSTPGGVKSLAMNSTYPIAAVKSFKVLPGDVVNASVMAYYPTGVSSSEKTASAMASLLAAVIGESAPGLVDGISTSYTTSTGANPNFLLSPTQGGKPSAYLNYILFDETFTPVEAKSQPLGGADVLHAVVLPTISVKEPGHLLVYLSYDNEAGGIDVRFDDLKITYTESPLIQLIDYYPFGMPSFTWERDGEIMNRYHYQGKEKNDQTGWQEFGSRVYYNDLGRWFAVDPQLQFASPYLAMGNNPGMTIDPNGEYAVGAVVIGAIIGAYIGGTLANNGQRNPIKWDYNAGRTWGYMTAGAIVGGFSGGIASEIAASGMPFANTAAAMAGSFVNSVGTAMYTGGQTDMNISFGVASYNFTANEWGYLGKPGNSFLETVGFSLGAFALASDVTAFAQGAYNSPNDVELKTDWHSELNNENGEQIFSYGVNRPGTDVSYTDGMAFKQKLPLAFKNLKKDLAVDYDNGSDWFTARSVKISRFNMEKFNAYKNSVLTSNKFYRFTSVNPFGIGNSMHCTIAASRALFRGGVFNIPFLRMPWTLDIQMRMRQYSYMSYALTP